MAQPKSPTDIVNLCALELYTSKITSINDSNSNLASYASSQYDQCRRSCIQDFDWNFARWRAMAPLVTGSAPAFDFEAYYQLPTDLVRLLWIGKDWNRYNPFRYDIQGSYLLLHPTDPAFTGTGANPTTPPASVPIKYSRDVTDVTQMDPLFIDWFVLELSARLCMPVTGDPKLQQQLIARAMTALQKAQTVNRMTKPIEVTERDPIMEARWMAGEGYQLNIDPSVW